VPRLTFVVELQVLLSFLTAILVLLVWAFFFLHSRFAGNETRMCVNWAIFDALAVYGQPWSCKYNRWTQPELDRGENKTWDMILKGESAQTAKLYQLPEVWLPLNMVQTFSYIWVYICLGLSFKH